MAENRSAESDVNHAHGHLSVRIHGAHPPDVLFAFASQRRRMVGSLATTLVLDTFVVLLIAVLGHLPRAKTVAAAHTGDAVIDHIVWLPEVGPGGGGGGGGNHMPDPPKVAELRGPEKISVPASPPAPFEVPQPKPPEETAAVQQLSIPAVNMAAAMQDLPGANAAPGTMTLSQGNGSGGGAGTGNGAGIGPGNGSGLGPGSGGNTGGSVYQPGNGVSSPVPIEQPRPTYTADAMRARIQGTARVTCVVQPTGICTDIQIVRSLDRTFGLDIQAINTVKGWRFRPGVLLGKPVPVQITIDVAFTVR